MTNSTIRCRGCGVKLTPREKRYYDGTCEECERDWFERMLADRAPGEEQDKLEG